MTPRCVKGRRSCRATTGSTCSRPATWIGPRPTGGTRRITGTIRLIERDTDSFLAWAREPWACIIFNLHTAHDANALAEAAVHFRRLIDRGREHGGSYFLTYHRWATREQVLACYPQLREFLALKRKYDPEERFQSEWYRHYRSMLA